MKFQVQLYLREHRNGFHSLEVLGEPSLCVYAEDLDQAREDLELVLGDRLERLHPRMLSRYATAEGLRLELVELEEALEVETATGPGHKSTEVAVLVARDRKWQRLWLPRWDLRYWIPHKQDLAEAVRALMNEHITKLKPHDRLKARYERKEWLESLEIDTDPAPLEAFTGKLRGADILPEPITKEDPDEEDDEEDDEDEDGLEQSAKPSKKKHRKKKKRPPTPTLKRIGVPLSRQARAKDLERAYGRQREVEELLGLVQAPGASAFVVLGSPGVGKTTVLHELVYRIRDKRSPAKLRKRPVWFVDASRLIAGDGWFGDWQRQCLDVVQECIDAEVIWYIGDPLALLDAGKSVGSDQNVALLLKPYLAGRRVTVLAECSARTWAQVELRDAGFARLFNPYRLEEPDQKTLREILRCVARELEEELDLSISDEGLRAVEDLCRRFNGDGSRLGHAMHFLRRLMDEAAIARFYQTHDQPLGEDGKAKAPPLPPVMGRAEVVDRFCAETGMPAFLVRDDLPMDAEAVWQHFRGRIIGQEEAVRRMTDLVALMKAGLADLERPLGSFLFVGPTGVGKTEMAKALTEFLFGRRDRMIRFDMSEFISAESVHRFLGDAGQEGALISHVRRSPFSVLLLDEIEKAHPAIFDVLLQVLGEARLTDQAGRTADFRNTVVLMTSNLGVETWKGGVGFGASAASGFREHFLAEAGRFFRPEFVGRIDHIVPFMPLEADAISQITRRELSHFVSREGLRQRELEVDLSDEVHEWIAERGVEPKYGARPLRRLIERRLTAPLARHLSSRRAAPAQQLEVHVEGESLEFALQDGQAQQKKSSAQATLHQFLTQVARVRTQARRWMDSGLYKTMIHDLRLLDRLSQDRNFWLDQQRAEERLRHSQSSREMQQGFTSLRDQIASLEDLAYEAYYDRNVDPLPMLSQEFQETIANFDRLEMSLFARRFEREDTAMLYLQAGQGGQHHLRTLVRLYVRLASTYGWTLGLKVAVEDPDVRAERIREAEEKRRKKNRKDEEEEKTVVKVNKKLLVPEAWMWKARTKLRLRQKEDSDKVWEHQQKDFINMMMAGPEDTLYALHVQGPFAPAMLCGETGDHLLQQDSDTVTVKVRFGDVGHGGPDHPLEAMKLWSSERRRLLSQNRRLVSDLVLGLSLPLEPRLYLLYERMMRANLYHQVFGQDAYKLFERRDLTGGAV